jgi:1,4-dihydroxy-2-naphthoyl-CoA synthase
MSILDTSPSSNGHGSSEWLRSWTDLRLDRRSPRYCRVTFDHPPVNAITATTVAELVELVGLIELDRDLNVVVFDSANPDVYLGDFAVERDPAWSEGLVRLSRAPVVSIASIRGCVRGAGNAFVLACDLRFASCEHTLVHRVIADDELDDEVEAIASRFARLDHEAIVRSKL